MTPGDNDDQRDRTSPGDQIVEDEICFSDVGIIVTG